ncbi:MULTISPECIES: restriction endonuclease subunit S [Marinobacter]|uniref:restriction endonuclease subunit S n=1 Tax=Marinobacter TaxID=2742 RepID=UPI0011A502E7|nr:MULTISPECIES: restriction endonuclease subunit S [Marinobacter]
MSNTVPNDWEAASLRELCKFSGGSAFKEKYQGRRRGEYPFIKVSDMNIDGNHRFITNANHWIDQATKIEAKIKLFPASSVVFAKVGAALLLNRRRILTRETAIDNNMMAAIPNSDDNNFLYYVLQEVDLREIVQGGAVPSVNQAQMEDIPTLIPPLPEQQKIATILSSVDDVIEKTRAQIDKLKDLKTGMMQELLTKGIGHTEFKDSPVGRIPESWAVVPLSEIVQSKVLGTTLRGQGDQNVLLLKMGNLLNGEVVYSKQEWVSYSSEIEPLLLQHGDLLFNTRNTPELVGKSANYVGMSNSVTYDNNLLRLRFYNSMNSFFVGYFLNLPTSLQSLAQLVSGTTSVAAIYWKDMASLLISVPPKVEQDQIVAAIGAISAKIDITTRKLADLRQLKKALMQDLLTGKVRVKVDQKESAVA